MRFLPAFVSLSLVVVTGCASTMGGGQERVVVAVDGAGGATQTSSEVVEVTEVVPMVAPEPVQARPRLTQTVTLGQGASEAAYTTGVQPQQATGTNGPSGPNVVVNNNITVVGTPGAVGGYGGYGRVYGGYYGGVRDYGRGSGSTGRSTSYAPTGWEGAGRTAAPGHTPHVGGNWAPAPSHGPRSMR